MNLQNQLNAGRSLVARLQQEIDQARHALAALPSEYGYESTEEFIQAVIAAQPKKTRRRRRTVTIAAAVPLPAARAPETAVVPTVVPVTAAPAPVLGQAAPLHPPLGADMAPTAVPEQGDLNETAYHAVLGGELTKTKEKLSTAGLPAAVWTAWREYERKLREAFNRLASGPV